MMSFYKKLGLQFVIGAPYEKRVAVLEHMDTIVASIKICDAVTQASQEGLLPCAQAHAEHVAECVS
ncbi:hypothetical protein [Bradyrhizobium sp. WSM2793]|uniref:hypothetical protein n=1 Tax=Bradyrhizobium sp. WSM2793 TaxID=1038866 RepID=UPI00037193C8|nr:hypothetical protein [Bradyrhizobium sp. WSM2793]